MGIACGHVAERREIRRQVLDRLRARGFLPDTALYSRFPLDLYCQRERASQLIAPLLLRTPATGIPIDKIWTIAGFGYALGRLIRQMVCGSSACADATAPAATLFHCLTVVFDYVCDEQPALRSELVGRINDESLALALSADAAETVFGDCRSISNPCLRFAVDLAEETFRALRDLRAASDRPAVWCALADAVLRAYRAEVQSLHLSMTSAEDLAAVSYVLREKSSLGSFILLLIALLDPEAPAVAVDGLEDAAMRIGDAFWIVDDLADAEIDLSRRSWGYPWIEFAKRGGVLLDSGGAVRPTGELLAELAASGAISACCDELCERYGSGVTLLEARFGHTRALSDMMRIGVQSWADSICETRPISSAPTPSIEPLPGPRPHEC